jgi:hypothetical protein
VLNSTTLLATTDQLRQRRISRCYSVYGLRIRTSIPLTLPEVSGDSGCDLEVLAGDPAFFEDHVRNLTFNSDWAQAHRLPGRWLFARLAGLFDFILNPDGSQILFRPLGEFSTVSFETYLLGLLMKAILIKKGIHSLHASAVLVDGKAVAFLGFNGFGKSSLAASFVSAGYPLFTDDVLRLDESGCSVYPGPGWLKLLPDSCGLADMFSEGVPMDPNADKCLFPVAADLRWTRGTPLAAIYCLPGPGTSRGPERISIDALAFREALTEILYGTHRDPVVELDRATNPFHVAKRIVAAVPVRRITYPWNLALLHDVRGAIVADLRCLSAVCGERSLRSV